MCPPASVSYAYGREEINLPHGRLKTLAALRSIYTLVQSAVLRLHVVRLYVRPSVRL